MKKTIERISPLYGLTYSQWEQVVAYKRELVALESQRDEIEKAYKSLVEIARAYCDQHLADDESVDVAIEHIEGARVTIGAKLSEVQSIDKPGIIKAIKQKVFIAEASIPVGRLRKLLNEEQQKTLMPSAHTGTRPVKVNLEA